jgi:DNA-binding transcriptional LysR family regulator
MAGGLYIPLVLAVARHRSVSKAVAALGIAQPALTKSIRRRDERNGVTLFERLPPGMQLTLVRQVLACHAQLIDFE